VKRPIAPVLALAVAVAVGCAGAMPGPATSPPPPALDVIYVATDLEVVRAMLEAAKVGPGDLVYDLGCYGARGVGVDLDPERIREARAHAARAGVGDRVTFVLGDLFATDVSAATVVALYLSPEINLRLRPKLQRELRPGSRIVSHQFDMGDWMPARTLEVATAGAPRRVFLWRIP
jgi:hypothetical protein